MLALILWIALIGLLVYLIETYVPMSPPFKIVIRVVVILGLILYLMRLFGVDLAIPRVR